MRWPSFDERFLEGANSNKPSEILGRMQRAGWRGRCAGQVRTIDLAGVNSRFSREECGNEVSSTSNPASVARLPWAAPRTRPSSLLVEWPSGATERRSTSMARITSWSFEVGKRGSGKFLRNGLAPRGFATADPLASVVIACVGQSSCSIRSTFTGRALTLLSAHGLKRPQAPTCAILERWAVLDVEANQRAQCSRLA